MKDWKFQESWQREHARINFPNKQNSDIWHKIDNFPFLGVFGCDDETLKDDFSLHALLPFTSDYEQQEKGKISTRDGKTFSFPIIFKWNN